MSQITYSDGKAVEAEIAAVLNASDDVGSLSRIALKRFSEWPFRYHLSPERGNLLRPFHFAGLDVVEFGAGLGAVSRGVAEQCKSLYLVEGTVSRFEAAKARLRDLNNWDGVAANLADVPAPRQFDVALCIGVLEYAEKYLTPPPDFKGDAFAYGLHLMRQWLKPGGVLIIAIENQLGLKYWAGAAEDHTGYRFDGVCGYPEGPSPKTFSRKELAERLKQAELAVVDEYFPFPDYKMPHALVTAKLAHEAPEAAAALAASRPFEDYHREKRATLCEPLALRELCKAGLFGDFANSFLFVACADADSEIRKQLLEGHDAIWAWHYTVMRHRPVETLFVAPGQVEKNELTVSGEKPKYRKMRWFSLKEPMAHDGFLRFSLLSLAFFGEREKFLRRWANFAQSVFTKFESSEGNSLQGASVDALITNALFDAETGKFSFFDQEWKALEPVGRSWWVLRNALSLSGDVATLALVGFVSIADLYHQLCEAVGVEPRLTHDILLECQLQVDVTGLDTPLVLKGIEEVVDRPFPKTDWREGASQSPSIKKSAKELGAALRLRANREMQKLTTPLRPILEGVSGRSGASGPADANA